MGLGLDQRDHESKSLTAHRSKAGEGKRSLWIQKRMLVLPLGLVRDKYLDFSDSNSINQEKSYTVSRNFSKNSKFWTKNFPKSAKKSSKFGWRVQQMGKNSSKFEENSPNWPKHIKIGYSFLNMSKNSSNLTKKMTDIWQPIMKILLTAPKIPQIRPKTI